MNTNKTIALIAAVLVLASLQKKTANINQNQTAVTANPGQLTRNPLDGQLYYYFDPSAFGSDPASDSIYGVPTVDPGMSVPWNEALGNGANAADPNFIGVTDAGNPIKFQF